MNLLNEGIETQIPPIMDGISDFLNIDPSAEPQKEQTNRRAIRWIVMAGNVLPPQFTRQVAEMRMGGENLAQSCKTLVRASNGFLRRCQLTPMTLAYDFLNADTVGTDKTRYKTRSRFDPKTFKTEIDYYVDCLPGDEIETLLGSQQGANGLFDIGIREVEALFDESATEPNSPEFNRAMKKGLDYQHLIFPDWKKYLNGEPFFPTTQALTAFLQQRRSELIDDFIAVEIIDVLLESNEQFERYATARLAQMKDTIEAGKADGVIYQWAAQHVMWFEMLVLNREAFLMKRSDAPKQSEVSREEFQRQSQKLDNLMSAVEAITPAIGKLAEIAVSQAKPEKAVFAVGDVVQVEGKGEGIITAKPFGKYKVSLSDGAEEVFKADQISAA